MSKLEKSDSWNSQVSEVGRHVLFSKYVFFFHSTTAEVSLYALLVVKRKKEAKFGACAISSK